MSKPQLSLYELYSIKKKKDLYCNNTFNIILEKCHKKIKTIAESGGMNTFYEIPFFILGLPLYDLNNCINYIVKSLKNNGLLVYVLTKPNNIIYISWNPNDIDIKYKKKLLM